MPDDLAPKGYYDELGSHSLMPGWARPRPSIWPKPAPVLKTQVWRAAEARRALEAASRFVGTDMAERRNLILVNPAPGNDYATTRNIVAAYQMIQPGETARSHRHTPNALRLVLDVEPGVYTVVDGTRIDMAPGDVVLTPGWCFHGHANESSGTAFWIDFLDVPFVQHIEAMFFEHHPSEFERPTRSEPDSPFRISLFKALGEGREARDVELAPGKLPTIGLHAERLPAGASTGPRQSTANNILAVVKGSLQVEVDGDPPVTLSRGDMMAVPLWKRYEARGTDDAAFLRVTDEPLMAKLGFLRQA